MEITLFETLKEAYETSTHNFNCFEKAIKSVKWDNYFYVDGEHNYCIGKFTFSTPSLNPFNMDWKPSAFFSDGSIIEF